MFGTEPTENLDAINETIIKNEQVLHLKQSTWSERCRVLLLLRNGQLYLYKSGLNQLWDCHIPSKANPWDIGKYVVRIRQ